MSDGASAAAGDFAGEPRTGAYTHAANPLHPAVVHFPVVLAFLLPLFVAGGFWALRRGVAPRRAWLLPTIVAGAIAVSAWVSVETGEAQDERVERVVSESAIEAHEELAEAFLATSAAIALISAAVATTMSDGCGRVRN